MIIESSFQRLYRMSLKNRIINVLHFFYRVHVLGEKISKYSVDSGFNSHYDEDAQVWYAKHIKKIIHKRNIL